MTKRKKTNNDLQNTTQFTSEIKTPLATCRFFNNFIHFLRL